MHTDQTAFIQAVHERAQAQQPTLKRRVNSSLAGLFGAGQITNLLVGVVSGLPWWATVLVAAVLAVAEVAVQAFSKAPLAPSQGAVLTRVADEIQAEANAAPSETEQRLDDMQETLTELSAMVSALVASPAVVPVGGSTGGDVDTALVEERFHQG